MNTPELITLYDIASGPPIYPYAPNPWKARYALNFTGAPYRTHWVELPEVAATRKRLGLAACRRNADGSDFHTLPIIHDPSTGTHVGDSFDIAVYLDRHHRRAERTLFPGPGTVALSRAFNGYVDALFTAHVQLAGSFLPFNPATAAATKAAMAARAGFASWDDIELKGEERRARLVAFEEALEPLAKLYEGSGGPFLEGREVPMYADFIVGGWLQMLRSTLPEWVQLKRGWNGGVWGRVSDALEEFNMVHQRDDVYNELEKEIEERR